MNSITSGKYSEEQKKRLPGACSICGVLRKRLLNTVSRDIGAKCLAVGHNLDDEAQTVLMNYLKGDIERLCRLNPDRTHEGLVPRVKPLAYVPEIEVMTYASLRGIEVEYNHCPYISSAYRRDIRAHLNQLDALHPGTKYGIVRGYEKLIDVLPTTPFSLGTCERCGEPTTGKLCKVCEMLDSMDIQPPAPKDDRRKLI
ncbi:MAG: TIGR00269 family protein [Methermicoccaceae archaeon]